MDSTKGFSHMVQHVGVPRVFPEHQLPEQLQELEADAELSHQGSCCGADDSGRPTARQVLATMQQCRVNISVRHTAPQSAEGATSMSAV
jgi:hypothetical protein